jgi:putative membrane protein
MVVKFLAPAAVAGLLLSAMAAPAPVAAQQAGLATDSSFMQMAGSLGLLQVKLGKLAEKKGSSAGVTDFGKRMVAEYSQTNEELAAAAKQAAFPAPVVLREHKQAVDRFLGTSRSSFDKNYMAAMVDYDRQAVDLFKQEAENGRVASLKALASRMLPAVQQHLALATQTAGSVGADVTASTSSRRQGS